MADENAETFDQIVTLASEIVVIKSRLQQLVGVLNAEARDNKNTQAVQKTETGKGKRASGGHQSTVSGLEEETSHLSKVLSELQSVLMKAKIGSSSIKIMQVLLARVDDGIFAFPLGSVNEIVNTHGKDIYSVDGNETLRLRDHALGLISLDKTLGFTRLEAAADIKQRKVVVVSDGTASLGVVIDDLLGEEDIVIKPLPRHFSEVKGVCGASILGDGKVSLLLDVPAMVSLAQGKK